MATKNQIKFYRLSATAMSTKTVSTGAIWFNTDDKTIQIKTATGWDKYAGKLNDAQWDTNKQKLTISKYDGSSIELDFSDIASGSSVKAALDALETKLQKNIDGANTAASNAQSAAEAAQADVDAVEEKLGDGFSKDSTVTAQLAAVKTTADAAAVKATVDAELDKKANVATTYSKTEVDGLVNVKADANNVYTKSDTDAAIKVVSDALAQEVADRADAIDGLQDQIDDLVAGTVEVKHAEGDKYVEVSKVDGSTTYTVSTKGIDTAISTAVGAETANRESAISTLQGEVDGIETKVNTLVGSDADKSVRAIAAEEVAAQLIPENAGEALDTLQEIAAWIQAHPGDASAMNADIETLKSKVGEKAVSVQISDAISALSDEAKSSDNENLVKVTVSQADGNVTGVSVDDAKLDAKFKSTDDAVALNATAIEGHKTRIETLEATSGALGTTYVKVSDYATDKAALQGEIDAAEGRLDTAEGDIDTLQAAIERLDGEQDSQDQAIAAADAKGAQGIADAATALAKANEKVASVSAGNDYVSVGGISTAPTVSVNVTGDIADGNTGLVTGGKVFEALCWAEFE